MLIKVLEDYGFTTTEAKTYLAVLELGNAPVSTIARRCGENRVTIYSVLKNFVKRGIATEVPRQGVTYYHVISVKELIQKNEEKIQSLQAALPEFLAIANKYDNKPKVQFYDGIEGLKIIYKDIILSGKDMPKDEPFLTFVGTSKIDPVFLERLNNEWSPWRLKFKRKSKAIAAKSTSKYSEFNIKTHDSIVIDDPIFGLANEIVMYGNSKVAILMYQTNELCGLSIDSLTLHNGLKSMFNLIRKLSKKNQRKK